MLRTDSSDRLAPQPMLADLPTLMTQVREAGLPVEFRVDGERRELPVGIELSAYRIVQEALTNALKHAGRRARRGQRALRAGLARARDHRRRRRDPGRCPRRRARPGRHPRAGHPVRGQVRRFRPPGRRFRRPRAAAPMTTVADRRRPGAGPGRTTQDPGERAADYRGGEASDGAGRGRRRPAAATGRGAHGHPDAGARRHRGHQADRAGQPATRVLILTTFGLDDYVYDALRAGASGFMLKDAPPEEIARRGPDRGQRRRAARARPSPARLIEEFTRDSRPAPARHPPRRRRADARANARCSTCSSAGCPTRRSAASW